VSKHPHPVQMTRNRDIKRRVDQPILPSAAAAFSYGEFVCGKAVDKILVSRNPQESQDRKAASYERRIRLCPTQSNVPARAKRCAQ
jgi:hypothetical protein